MNSGAVDVERALASVLFEEAMRQESLDDTSKAVSLYIETIAQDGTFVPAYERLGVLLGNMGLPEKAAEMWEQALSLDPSRASTYANLGRAYEEMGEGEKAHLCYKRGIEACPDYWRNYFNYGVLAHEQGDYERAIQFYERSISLNPDDAMSLNNIGIALLCMGRIDEAHEYFRRCVEIDPDGEAGRLAAGNLSLVEQDGFEDNLRISLKLQTAAGSIIAGDSYAGIAGLEDIIKERPDCWQAWFFIGVGRRQLAQLNEAVAAFQRVIALNPGNVDAASELGVILGDLGHHEEAYDAARLAYEGRPDDAGIVCNFGMASLRMGKLKQAERMFAMAKSLDPSDPVIDNCIELLRRLSIKDRL